MSHSTVCFRCGQTLAGLSLPFTRRDHCPSCGVDLHVCKMCLHYDPSVASQCREDDAEDVKEKELANFCEYFDPSEQAFDPQRKSEADKARESLEALFTGIGDKDQKRER